MQLSDDTKMFDILQKRNKMNSQFYKKFDDFENHQNVCSSTFPPKTDDLFDEIENIDEIQLLQKKTNEIKFWYKQMEALAHNYCEELVEMRKQNDNLLNQMKSTQGKQIGGKKTEIDGNQITNKNDEKQQIKIMQLTDELEDSKKDNEQLITQVSYLTKKLQRASTELREFKDISSTNHKQKSTNTKEHYKALEVENAELEEQLINCKVKMAETAFDALVSEHKFIEKSFTKAPSTLVKSVSTHNVKTAASSKNVSHTLRKLTKAVSASTEFTGVSSLLRYLPSRGSRQFGVTSDEEHKSIRKSKTLNEHHNSKPTTSSLSFVNSHWVMDDVVGDVLMTDDDKPLYSWRTSIDKNGGEGEGRAPAHRHSVSSTQSDYSSVSYELSPLHFDDKINGNNKESGNGKGKWTGMKGVQHVE